MSQVASNYKNKVVAAGLSIILAVGLCLPVTNAFAEPSLSERANAARAQLNEINTQVEAAAERYGEAMIRIDEANAKIEEETAKSRRIKRR